MSKADRTLHVAHLKNSLDDDALKLLGGFHFATPVDERTTAEILEAFDRHVIGITNETQERYILAVAGKKLSHSITSLQISDDSSNHATTVGDVRTRSYETKFSSVFSRTTPENNFSKSPSSNSATVSMNALLLKQPPRTAHLSDQMRSTRLQPRHRVKDVPAKSRDKKRYEAVDVGTAAILTHSSGNNAQH